MSLLIDMKIVTDEDAIWRALAEPIRGEILDLLAVAPRTTGELNDGRVGESF